MDLFYRQLVMEHEDCGEDLRAVLAYHHFVFAWYGFRDLLATECTLAEGFKCPVCADEPEIIICDGTTLGFQRKFLDWSDNFDVGFSCSIPVSQYCGK